MSPESEDDDDWSNDEREEQLADEVAVIDSIFETFVETPPESETPAP